MATDITMDRIVWSTNRHMINGNIINNNNNNDNNGREGNSATAIIIKNNKQHFIVDIVVTIIALPTLICFALLLDNNMRHDWTEQFEDRWTVFGLGLGFLIISLFIGGYVTHRMGVCLWTGPLDDTETCNNTNTGTNNNYRINSQIDILRIIDNFPPSYEIACKMNFDTEAPPPTYDSIVFSNESSEKVKYFIINETSTYI